ncbi:amidohydrolase family protein [Novosphingobium taihuense]|uniref:Putative TIM-barrel fold metal-dependent hydrolase n=1 Tax=Novosphingobium taihuense TaxID=260085 RepID=A0A7W7EUD3_9SPHN|nr:amidohydrolase family protein [Novosphingobium taihuense]MBB4614207.1 putative TIM-barrel fold metal-dependent hydrolase [Novosphingobium taihuense]TWH87056.1 putative TIM-barrel fold metal-dependent hydrolase [Novosphingobium taihuense]
MLDATFTQDTPISPVDWPMDRETKDSGWRPPAGTRVISVDDHGMEEEGLWEKRLSGADKGRAPKLWQDKSDNRWHMTVDGMSYDVPGIESHIGEGRPGFWDAKERLKDMDAEGIDVSLFFHSRAMSLVRLEDKAFFTRCMDAYNEWLAETCAANPSRLVGVGILPTIYKPEDTAAYIDKLKGWGIKALEIPSAPKNVPYNASAMEPMWEAIAASGIPVMFHVGAYLEFRGKGATGANLTKNLGPYRPLWSLLAFSGILERHPNLKVVFCEGGFGWVPWTLQDADRIYQVYETEMKPKLQELPSYYFRRQCYSAIMSDDVGLKLAKEYDLTDNMLWSCDYPHGESVFGESRNEIKKIFDVLGEEKGKDVAGRNAAKLWNL